MSRIVFDSNVFIPSLAFGRGPRFDLIMHCLEHHQVFYSAFIRDEVSDKLVNKFTLPTSIVARAMELIQQLAVIVEPAAVAPSACRDPNDLPILGTALRAKTDLLVTGDKDLLSLTSFQNIPIKEPATFWAWERNLASERR